MCLYHNDYTSHALSLIAFPLHEPSMQSFPLLSADGVSCNSVDEGGETSIMLLHLSLYGVLEFAAR